MQQFIPFEDEWAMLDAQGPDALVPYQVGVPLGRAVGFRPGSSGLPPMPDWPSGCAPMRLAALARGSGAVAVPPKKFMPPLPRR